MAVYYATRQYRILGRCLRPDQIKTWIRSEERSGLLRRRSTFSMVVHEELPSAASVLTVSAPNMLLSSSLNSFLIGLGIYLGFTWIRKTDENAKANNSRDVFITYIVGLAVCYIIYALSGAVVADQSYVSEAELLDGFRKEYSAAQGKPDYSKRASKQSKAQSPPGRQESLIQDPDSETGALSSGSLDIEIIPVQTTGVFSDDITRTNLIAAFREAAALRQESARADEKLAQLLERLA